MRLPTLLAGGKASASAGLPHTAARTPPSHLQAAAHRPPQMLRRPPHADLQPHAGQAVLHSRQVGAFQQAPHGGAQRGGVRAVRRGVAAVGAGHWGGLSRVGAALQHAGGGLACREGRERVAITAVRRESWRRTHAAAARGWAARPRRGHPATASLALANPREPPFPVRTRHGGVQLHGGAARGLLRRGRKVGVVHARHRCRRRRRRHIVLCRGPAGRGPCQVAAAVRAAACLLAACQHVVGGAASHGAGAQGLSIHDLAGGVGEGQGEGQR